VGRKGLIAWGMLIQATWRASSLGVDRFWRDLGYAIGALLSGLIAETVGLAASIHVVAARTLLSGGIVGWVMRQPAPARATVVARRAMGAQSARRVTGGETDDENRRAPWPRPCGKRSVNCWSRRWSGWMPS
jgi:hypothetical protein